jgi:adenosylhomocysteinase
MGHEIRDIHLAESGRKKINWVKQYMPIMKKIEEDFEVSQSLKGLYVTVSVHLEAKTAYFCEVLATGGAEVSVTGSNPLSTQDDVAAALAKEGMNVYAWHGATDEEYENHLSEALGCKPNIIVDDGGDLISLIHTKKRELLPHLMGGCEETTTGIQRLMAMERENQLKIPMVAVNNAQSKHLFDNRYGTGQSVWDGITRTTNLIIAGKSVVVAGYGWCGKGVASRAKGLGANVIVTEVDPIRSIEAMMDGFEVMKMDKAASIGDIFVTVTGCSHVINNNHFRKMKDGVILCNAGHFDVEICMEDLRAMSSSIIEQKENIKGYVLDDKTINVIAEGRLVNLASGDGHPAEIMDMSFAIQALSVLYMSKRYLKLGNKLVNVPIEIDQKVALMKLETMGLEIDKLTEEQKRYINAWSFEGAEST